MIIDLNCGSKTSRSSSVYSVNSFDVRGLSAVVCRRGQRCCQCDQLIWGGWQFATNWNICGRLLLTTTACKWWNL